jgi:hypothetical protein
MNVPISLRAASVLLWVSTFGLGIPCLMAIRNLFEGRGISYVLGFPAYGGGGFERHGLVTTVPLLIGFLIVVLIEGYAGWLLWNGHKTGGVLALILLLPGAVYWWGFDLPYPPIAAIIRTVLILIGWTRLP